MTDIIGDKIVREVELLHAWLDDYPIEKVNFVNRLAVIENKIRYFDYECAFAFDINGDHVLTKIGNDGSITFTGKEKKKLVNCILTHNHPIDATLSSRDINFFIGRSLYEMRAVSRKHTFALRSGIEGAFTPINGMIAQHFNKYCIKNAHKMIGNNSESEVDDSYERMFIQYLVDKQGLVYIEERNPFYV